MQRRVVQRTAQPLKTMGRLGACRAGRAPTCAQVGGPPQPSLTSTLALASAPAARYASSRVGRCWLLLLLPWGLLAGCGLPALPLPQDEPEPPLDERQDLDSSELDPVVCSPGTRVCQDLTTALLCAPDGRRLRPQRCAESSICVHGECVPQENACRPGDLLSLSHDLVLFDVREDLKPTIMPLTLLSCGAGSIKLQKVALDSPTSPSGVPVFSLEGGSPQGLELPPGTPLRMKVRLQPRQLGWAERGRLFLTVEADGQLIQRQVELRTRTWCVGMTPRAELGLVTVGQPVTAQATVYNCGSMPLTLSGARLTHLHSKEDPQRATLRGLARPTVLPPGQRLELEATWTPHHHGPLRAQLDLEIPEQDARYLIPQGAASMAIQGWVAADSTCRDDVTVYPPLFEPQLLWDPRHEHEPLTLAPMTVHGFDVPLPDPSWRAWVELDPSSPAASPSDVMLVQSQGRHWLMSASVADHTLRVHLFDEQGVPACQQAVARVQVRPRTPLYVELRWEAPDDAIPWDLGGARGPNVDLYVRARQSASARVTWRDPAYSCSTRHDEGWLEPCLEGRAALLGANTSGHLPEVFASFVPLDGVLDVGVLVINAGFYEPAVARVRVWRDGQIDERFEQLAPRALTSPSGFWLVGSIEPTLSAPLDFYFSTGLPEP